MTTRVDALWGRGHGEGHSIHWNSSHTELIVTGYSPFCPYIYDDGNGGSSPTRELDDHYPANLNLYRDED
jgi:hypothetical protein